MHSNLAFPLNSLLFHLLAHFFMLFLKHILKCGNYLSRFLLILKWGTWEHSEGKRTETLVGSTLCGLPSSSAMLGVESRDFFDLTCYLCVVSGSQSKWSTACLRNMVSLWGAHLIIGCWWLEEAVSSARLVSRPSQGRCGWEILSS